MDGVESKDTVIMAFRLPIQERDTLLGKSKPGETKSQLMRRVVKKFIGTKKRVTDLNQS